MPAPIDCETGLELAGLLGGDEERDVALSVVSPSARGVAHPPMYTAVSRVKMYACRKPTRISKPVTPTLQRERAERQMIGAFVSA